MMFDGVLLSAKAIAEIVSVRQGADRHRYAPASRALAVHRLLMVGWYGPEDWRSLAETWNLCVCMGNMQFRNGM